MVRKLVAVSSKPVYPRANEPYCTKNSDVANLLRYSHVIQGNSLHMDAATLPHVVQIVSSLSKTSSLLWSLPFLIVFEYHLVVITHTERGVVRKIAKEHNLFRFSLKHSGLDTAVCEISQGWIILRNTRLTGG